MSSAHVFTFRQLLKPFFWKWVGKTVKKKWIAKFHECQTLYRLFIEGISGDVRSCDHTESKSRKVVI